MVRRKLDITYQVFKIFISERHMPYSSAHLSRIPSSVISLHKWLNFSILCWRQRFLYYFFNLKYKAFLLNLKNIFKCFIFLPIYIYLFYISESQINEEIPKILNHRPENGKDRHIVFLNKIYL